MFRTPFGKKKQPLVILIIRSTNPITISEAVSPGDASEEVGGHAAFWNLISLATTAIVQPSGRSKIRNRDAFDGNTNLLRSLSAVCFLKAIAYSFSILNAIHQRPSTVKQIKNTHRIILPPIVKSALWVVTVTAQTVKVPSLKRVPGTQACALIFFTARMIRLIIGVCGRD